jgi:site-specific recombinase XerC
MAAVTKEDLLVILEALREKLLTNHSRNVILSSWRVFFSDLTGRGLLPADPTGSLRYLRSESLPRHMPTQEEMCRLLKTPSLAME